MSVEGGDTDAGNNGKEARQEKRRLEDQELTKKGSEKLDIMQGRMGSREPNEKRCNNIIKFQVFHIKRFSKNS